MTCAPRCFKPDRHRGSWAGSTFLPDRSCAVVVRLDGVIQTLYHFGTTVPIAWVASCIEQAHPDCSYTLEPRQPLRQPPSVWELTA